MRPKRWTEMAIKQAFDEFIEEYGRLPTKTEMYEKYKGDFPRALSVKLTTGLTMGEYFEKNYTEFRNKIGYGKVPKECWIEDFKKQYKEYNYPTEAQYNKMRNGNTPNTQTLAKTVGVSTWREVLSFCGFGEDKKINGILIFEKTVENYQIIDKKLRDFMALHRLS